MVTHESSARRQHIIILVLAAIAFALGVALITHTALVFRDTRRSTMVQAATSGAVALLPTRAPTALPAPTADAGPSALRQTATQGSLSATAAHVSDAATQTIQTAVVEANDLAQKATVAALGAPQAQAALGSAIATSAYAPDLDSLLLLNGYRKNIIRVGGRFGLRASQLNYSNSFWTRDLDYAISGYSYPLGNMSVFADNISLFLSLVQPDGVAPETIYLRAGQLDSENRQSWDSMPNLIHAVYVYVAKTGDRALYTQHRDTLLHIGGWIAALDSDNDGLPDQDIFPFGYYDSVENGPLHTYALAKFYAAYNELAELEEATGEDGTEWRDRAAKLRAGFHRPLAEGGYWPADQAWPIAWRRADGREVRVLETFGVFEALRSGLIAPADGAHYDQLIAVLHEQLPKLIDGPTPMRLTLDPYSADVRRVVDPPVPLWMLDNSAPWIVGLAAPAYAAAGLPDDARQTLDAYAAMARTTAASGPPVMEFAAGADRTYGAGDSRDRGRTWDSAAWFLALYSGHYGLHMTPTALIIHPRPFMTLPNDAVHNLSYQGARITLTLDAASATYRVQTDRAIRVTLQPMNAHARLRVDAGNAVPEDTRILQPGQTYVVTSEDRE